MKVASTKLANPEWQALQDKCNSEGVSISEYLRGLIHEDANHKINALKEEEKETPKEEDKKQSDLFRLLSKKNLKNESDDNNIQTSSTNSADDEQEEEQEEKIAKSKSSVSPKELSSSDSNLMRQELAKYASAMQQLADQLSEINRNLKEQHKNSESIPTSSPSKPSVDYCCIERDRNLNFHCLGSR